MDTLYCVLALLRTDYSQAWSIVAYYEGGYSMVSIFGAVNLKIMTLANTGHPVLRLRPSQT